MAVQNDDIELVQYSIDAGANLDIKDPDALTERFFI